MQPSLVDLVPTAWREVLAPELGAPAFEALASFVESERARGNVFPQQEHVFSALAHTSPTDVKAVLLGQDPYPTAGNANGLAFSVSPGMKVPASLKNVFSALATDVGVATPCSGDLTAWARQGVLLLNTVLTVREGAPGSHRKKGWEAVTTAILRHVNRTSGPVVFLAFGVPAQAMMKTVVDETRHHVLALPHPSPLNGKAFIVAAERMRPFSRANELLRAGARAAIDWSCAQR